MQTKTNLVVYGVIRSGVQAGKWVRKGYGSTPSTKTAQTGK